MQLFHILLYPSLKRISRWKFLRNFLLRNWYLYGYYGGSALSDWMRDGKRNFLGIWASNICLYCCRSVGEEAKSFNSAVNRYLISHCLPRHDSPIFASNLIYRSFPGFCGPHMKKSAARCTCIQLIVRYCVRNSFRYVLFAVEKKLLFTMRK